MTSQPKIHSYLIQTEPECKTHTFDRNKKKWTDTPATG